MDAVVARVQAALGRGHALFSAAPVDAGGAIQSSADTFIAAAGKMSDAAEQVDAAGQFSATYKDMAQRFSSRFAASGGQERAYAELLAAAVDAELRGRSQTGNLLLNDGASAASRSGPYGQTLANDQAVLSDLRDRVDQQRDVIARFKSEVSQLAARARGQAGRHRA
ncbi:hypothetical protein [Mycobacteroides abscessus]|uniref:hypothetical protein n=1 Tax=Mycobacteroides abscessus TaxID=36809 RepID=UPI001054A2EB|nr:hypothetical protein [Mycobacteroides abscessus]